MALPPRASGSSTIRGNAELGNKSYTVTPARQLSGVVRISGSKHVAQRCLVASLLTKDSLTLEGIPLGCRDPSAVIELLRAYGKRVEIDGDVVTVSGVPDPIPRQGVMTSLDLRLTTLLLGPLLSWHENALVPMPGGCRIGTRPFDLHELALHMLGGKVQVLENGVYASRRSQLQGAAINLSMLSNGAAECSILAACRAHGTTVITGVHVTPELLDLIALLAKMGARIAVSRDTVTVEGVSRMHGTTHHIIPDSAEAISYSIATMMVGGEVLVAGFPQQSLDSTIYRLSCIGGIFRVVHGGVVVQASPGQLSAFSITASRYPGASSDTQPLLAALGTVCDGTSKIADERWPLRLSHVEPLRQMGAKIDVVDGTQIIHGPQTLQGASVTANDIRCGMALLLAGLVSKHPSIINNAAQIERGYEAPASKFRDLGVGIVVHEDATA